jgi:hypothetical protein
MPWVHSHTAFVSRAGVVSCYANIKAIDLPLPKHRKKSEGDVVGRSAKSFEFKVLNEGNPMNPTYVVGSLVLPPLGIKDPEHVGRGHAQIFTLVKGEPQSLEIAFGDPDQKWKEGPGWIAAKDGHFRIAPGDNFHIPPGNTYRLRNHSATTPASLSWVIVGHGVQAKPDEENDKEEEKETIDYAARPSMVHRRLRNDNPSGVDCDARPHRRLRNDNPSGEPTGEPTDTPSDKPDEPPVDKDRNAEANEEAGNRRRDVFFYF